MLATFTEMRAAVAEIDSFAMKLLHAVFQEFVNLLTYSVIYWHIAELSLNQSNDYFALCNQRHLAKYCISSSWTCACNNSGLASVTVGLAPVTVGLAPVTV